MTRAALWILAAVGLSAALYFGVEAIKSASYAAGEAAISARVEAAKAEAVAAAASRARETAAALAARADQAEADAAARQTELRGLRDEMAKRDGDPVVFDNSWSCWLRGRKSCVAGDGR